MVVSVNIQGAPSLSQYGPYLAAADEEQETSSVKFSAFELRLKNVPKLTTQRSKWMAIRIIASEMAKAGLNKSEMIKAIRATLEAANTIENPPYRAHAIEEAMVALVKPGLFNETLGVARTMVKDPSDRSLVILIVVFKMADAGLLKESLELARTIEKPYFKSLGICDVASTKAKTFKKSMQSFPEWLGKTRKYKRIYRSEMNKIFKECLEVTRTVKGPIVNSQAIVNVVDKMADAGLLKESLELARTTECSKQKAFALSGIAYEMAKAGVDKSETSKVFKEALNIARTLDHGSGYKAISISAIAFWMAKAGFNKSETSKVFKEALNMARILKDSEFMVKSKSEIIRLIASEMAKVGFNKGEIGKVFKDAGVELAK